MLKTPAEMVMESELEITHPFATAGAERLSGVRFIVIGAGPAGLTFARKAAEQGAKVTVLEQKADPWIKSPGYTDRSFNITLDEVGRLVLGDERAWRGGIWLMGRALHQPQGRPVRYGSYGEEPETHLVSIPRPLLRQNLAALAQEAGAHLLFEAAVMQVDPEAGKVWYEQGGQSYTLTADLVVASDGLHSLSDKLTEPASKDCLRQEPRNYIAAILPPQDNHGLSLKHIHFWHEAGLEAYAIGLPNHDGSVALLLTSTFNDIDLNEHPFATPELAAGRLQRDYPQLHALAPQLAQQLPGRRRGRFHYKLAQTFVLGSKGVVVGDAGCAVPPWAGFGANGAMYAASALIRHLIEHTDDIPAALAGYQAEVHVLARLIMDYASEQGKFLSGPVVQNPNGRADSLRPLIREARMTALTTR